MVSARNQGETEVDSFGWRVVELAAGSPETVLAQGTGARAPPGAGTVIDVPLNLAEGEHLLRVDLDPDGTVSEAREDNNSAEIDLFVVDPNLPDLAVSTSDLSATPERPAPGDSVVASAVVHNLGQSDGTALVTLWDGAPGSGTLVASQSVTVAAGATQTVGASFTAGPGTAVLTAVVDPDDTVKELSESNNTARLVLADRPDLAIDVDNLDLSPLEPLAGETVQGAVTVRNAGTAPAASAVVTVYDGDPDAGGAEIFSGTVTDLPAGGNRTLAFTWTATGGLHSLTAVADPDDQVAELSEENNRAARDLAVARPGGANLTVAGVDLSGLVESSADLTATGTVAVTVANGGDADAGAFVVRLLEETDGDGRPSAGDRELAVATVAGGVAAGASATVDLPLDETFAFFHPLVWVQVDATDLVAESREDDNLGTLFGACRAAPPAPSLQPVEKWYLPGLEVESTPVVVELTDDNGDGRIDSRDVPDIVFHTEDAQGRAITARSGLDGSEIWTFRSSAANPLADRAANLAAADLDGDGVAEIIGVQSNRRLIALDHRGSVLWVSDPIESAGGYSWSGAVTVGDLTGDGVPEIVVGRSVLSNTGHLIAQGTANVGRNQNYYGPFGVPYLLDAPISTIADVDLDGRNELVAGDTLYRLEGNTLQVVWDRTVPDHLMVDGFTAVGNLDADPQAEIVYVSSNQVMVLNDDGSVLSPRRLIAPFLPLTDPTFWAGPPSLGDLDGDGTPDILIATQQGLYALRANLSTLWHVDTTERSEMTSAVAFDLDGDGKDEVLVLDQTTFRILDGATGATLYSRPNLSKTATESPVVADVDGDGRAEILVPSNRSFAGDTSTQGLHVLGNPSWRGTRPVWNEHTFHGTNVQSDGTVPAVETPAWQVTDGFRSNLELPAPVRYLPNPTLGLPRVGRAGTDGVPVTLRVGNGGRQILPAGVPVALYDGDPATSAAVARGATAGPLRPGAHEDVTILWQVAGASGQTAWARVDPDDQITECDEADDTLDFVVEESVLPDLSVPAGGLSIAGTPTAGQLLTASVQVDNAGAAEAPGFTVRLYDGEPAVGQMVGRVLGEATAPGLAPGDSTTVEIPWDTLGAVPGTHELHAVADDDDLVAETEEDNNEGLLEVSLASPGLPDLSAESLTVDPAVAASGDEVGLTAVILNRGTATDSGFPVAFLVNGAEVGRVEVPEALAPGESRTVSLTWSTAGRQGLLAVAAVADPDGSIDEVEEGNNRATAELQVGGPTLTASVTTDRGSYAPGDTVAIDVTAENLAADPRAVQLTVGIVDSAGARLADVASEALTLTPGTSSYSFTWEAGAALPGAYSAVAELSDAGTVVARGQALFSVARDVDLSARLYADRDSYAPGSSALLTGRVTSAGANTILTGLTARLAVTAPDGTEVFAASHDLLALYPGSEVPVEGAWDVGSAAPGLYTASLSLRDPAGSLLAFASTVMTVEDSGATGAGVRGELAVSPELVGAGAPLLANLDVADGGNADLPDLAFRVDLVALADGTVAASSSLPVPLTQGESARRSLAFDTSALPPGDYLATLVAVLPGTEARLDRAAFSVGAGVSVGDAEVAEGDSGTSLLVFPVTLSQASSEPVTVGYATADGTAHAGEDYQAAFGTLTFQPGETSKTVEVTVLGDTVPEADEVLVVSLSNPAGTLLGDAQALGTIRDEEGCPSPSLLADGGGEAGDVTDPVPGWSEVGAAGWGRRLADPVPIEGETALAAPPDATAAELARDVDLSPFAAQIDGGSQQVLFEGFVHSAAESRGRCRPRRSRVPGRVRGDPRRLRLGGDHLSRRLAGDHRSAAGADRHSERPSPATRHPRRGAGEPRGVLRPPGAPHGGDAHPLGLRRAPDGRGLGKRAGAVRGRPLLRPGLADHARLRDGRRHGPRRQRLPGRLRHPDPGGGRDGGDHRRTGPGRRGGRAGRDLRPRPLDPRRAGPPHPAGRRHGGGRRRAGGPLDRVRQRRRGRRRLDRRPGHRHPLGGERQDGDRLLGDGGRRDGELRHRRYGLPGGLGNGLDPARRDERHDRGPDPGRPPRRAGRELPRGALRAHGRDARYRRSHGHDPRRRHGGDRHRRRPGGRGRLGNRRGGLPGDAVAAQRGTGPGGVGHLGRRRRGRLRLPGGLGNARLRPGRDRRRGERGGPGRHDRRARGDVPGHPRFADGRRLAAAPGRSRGRGLHRRRRRHPGLGGRRDAARGRRRRGRLPGEPQQGHLGGRERRLDHRGRHGPGGLRLPGGLRHGHDPGRRHDRRRPGAADRRRGLRAHGDLRPRALEPLGPGDPPRRRGRGHRPRR